MIPMIIDKEQLAPLVLHASNYSVVVPIRYIVAFLCLLRSMCVMRRNTQHPARVYV